MYLDKFGTGGLNKNFPDYINSGPVFGKKELWQMFQLQITDPNHL